MKKIARKTEYFLDIPEEISTTGCNLCRGIYIFLEFSNGGSIWLSSQGNEISDNNWVRKLNAYKNEL
jgi:hypothetical protein